MWQVLQETDGAERVGDKPAPRHVGRLHGDGDVEATAIVAGARLVQHAAREVEQRARAQRRGERAHVALHRRVVLPPLVAQHVERVACKYVRREIRQLSDEDRVAYLSALEVVARDAPEALDAARARFGASFSNLDHFVRKHVFAPGCTPYHSGLSFFTSHAAFTLEMDRALQQVRDEVRDRYGFSHLLSQSPRMLNVFDKILV